MSYASAHLTVLILTIVGSVYMVSTFGSIKKEDTKSKVEYSAFINKPSNYTNMALRGNIPASPDGQNSGSAYVNAAEERRKEKASKQKKTRVSKRKVHGFEEEVYIEAVFSTYNLPEGFGRTMVRIESKTGREMVSPTNCKGWFQFCSAMAKHYKVNDPNSLVESTHGAANLGVDNRRSLRIYGVPPTGFHLYLAHMIGPLNAQSVWRTKNGKKVNGTKLINAAYKEMKSNWRVKSIGRKTWNHKVDFPKFYDYFKRKYDKISNPNYVFPTTQV